MSANSKSLSTILGFLFADLVAEKRTQVDDCVNRLVVEEEQRIAEFEEDAKSKGWIPWVKQDVRDSIMRILENCEQKYEIDATPELKRKVLKLYNEALTSYITDRDGVEGRGKKHKKTARSQERKKHKKSRKHKKNNNHKPRKKHHTRKISTK